MKIMDKIFSNAGNDLFNTILDLFSISGTVHNTTQIYDETSDEITNTTIDYEVNISPLIQNNVYTGIDNNIILGDFYTIMSSTSFDIIPGDADDIVDNVITIQNKSYTILNITPYYSGEYLVGYKMELNK